MIVDHQYLAEVFDEFWVSDAETADKAPTVVGGALTVTELADLVSGEANPFFTNEPLYGSWQPRDFSAWVVPCHPVPRSYLRIVGDYRVYSARTGSRFFEFYRLHELRAKNLAYQIPAYLPGALAFGSSGGGALYLFDMREPCAPNGEFPVVIGHTDDLGWGEDNVLRYLAPTFLQACRGTSNVEELLAAV